MASNPPGKCCTVGKLHDGTPTGETVQLEGNISGYLAKASSPTSAAVIIFPDVFGIWQNTKLLADEFAARGYTALIPDLFNGDQLDISTDLSKFDIMGWFGKGSSGDNPHGPEQVDVPSSAAVKYLKGLGYKRIGGAGYCIGAKYVVRHMKDEINVGFLAHPSFVSPEELTSITGPISIAAAEFDNIFPTEKRHETEELLLGDKVKQPFQINLFSGVHHGFGVRGDLSNKQVKYGKEQAFLQAVSWFDQFLKE
jgi:dienelactone hydrolase